MNKKIITWLLALTLLIASAIPLQGMMAQAPPGYCDYQYSEPKDFVRWVNDAKLRKQYPYSDNFVKAYKEVQGYILAPKMSEALLDEVCWGHDDVAINYRFHNDNISWRIFVEPLTDWREKYSFIEDIDLETLDLETLVQFEYGESKLNHTKEQYYTDTDGKIHTYTVCYIKKKLQIGDDSVVDCIQRTYQLKDENLKLEREDISLHFFKAGMYVLVDEEFNLLCGEKFLLEAMKKCTFEKYFTNAKLTLNKKKNKISKKNAILCATLSNPTDKKFTYVEFCLYDKKQKKIKIRHRKKVTAKSEQKETVGLKFNVQKVIKDWRKRGTSKRKYPLERKKKYKYMIRTKVGGGYLETVGTFRLK